MSFANRYGFNKKLAEDGVWITKGDGLDVKVRRLNSKAARAVITAENKKYSHLTKHGKDLPTDIADLINRRVCAYGVLLDWRDTPKGELNPDGLQGAPRDAGGNFIPFSPEAAIEQFLEYPDFLEETLEDSMKVDHFRDEERKELEGNS